mgnify:CR=1 FL=1
MPRTVIPLPDHFSFETSITIRVTDLNYGGHLSNEKIQGYLHEARVHFFHHLGLSEMNIGEHTSLIQGDAAMVFQAEGYLGDSLTVQLAVEDFGRSSFDVVYQLYNKTRNQVLASAKTRLVCYSYSEKKTLPIPNSFINQCADLTRVKAL